MAKKCSMRHQVKNNIDAERIAALLGKLVKESVLLALAFPGVAVVTVVRRDDHDAALVIENGADVHFPAFLAVMIFPGDTVAPAVWVQAADALAVIRRLQLVERRRFDVKNTKKNRMVQGQVLELAFGKDALDFVLEVVPLFPAPEIIGHEDAAVEQ